MVEDITPVSIEITYKTPEYCRILNKKYREKNKEKEQKRVHEYRKKKLQEEQQEGETSPDMSATND